MALVHQINLLTLQRPYLFDVCSENTRVAVFRPIAPVSYCRIGPRSQFKMLKKLRKKQGKMKSNKGSHSREKRQDSRIILVYLLLSVISQSY